jgi:hypothetical protein
MAKVKTLCRQVGTNHPLDALLARLNPALRGWCANFRPGVSSATFGYLGHYLWWKVGRWLRRKHPQTTRRPPPATPRAPPSRASAAPGRARPARQMSVDG